MGIKRIVDTSFWTDSKVDEFSPEDKYFMLYLLTNPFSTQLGIYEISIKQVAFQLGYSMDAVNVLLERFESKYGIIAFSKETNEIAIMNFLRHSIIKGGAPVRDCLIKEMKKVKNKDLISIVFSNIKGIENLNETVKNIIAEYEEKNGMLSYCNEKHNENENENENDVSCNDSCNDSSNKSFKKPKSKRKPKQDKPVKLKRGEYQNVLLTDEEEDKLIDEFGMVFALKAIDFLDKYIEETGYKRKNHFLCIKRWVIDAVKEKEEKAIKKGGTSKPRYGIFDPEEVMREAMAKPFPGYDPEPKEQPKTAGEDESIRKRAEMLAEQLRGHN